MYWTEFLTVALIHLLAVASPGPDFAVVVRESVTHGRRAGMFTAFGVGTAIFVHVGYSLLGIGIIVSQSIVLFNALKWLAAAYLLYIGIKALRAKPADPAALAASLPVGERTARGAFTSGFVTNGLNPKATLFFLSLFTVVINPHTPLSIQAGYGARTHGDNPFRFKHLLIEALNDRRHLDEAGTTSTPWFKGSTSSCPWTFTCQAAHPARRLSCKA